jgi:hypothetical protein
MSLKLLSMGIKNFFSNYWTILDTIAIILSVIQSSLSNPSTALIIKIFKLFKFIKVLKRWKLMQLLLDVVYYSISSSIVFSCYFFVVVFIYSILG